MGESDERGRLIRKNLGKFNEDEFGKGNRSEG